MCVVGLLIMFIALIMLRSLVLSMWFHNTWLIFLLLNKKMDIHANNWTIYCGFDFNIYIYIQRNRFIFLSLQVTLECGGLHPDFFSIALNWYCNFGITTSPEFAGAFFVKSESVSSKVFDILSLDLLCFYHCSIFAMLSKALCSFEPFLCYFIKKVKIWVVRGATHLAVAPIQSAHQNVNILDLMEEWSEMVCISPS